MSNRLTKGKALVGALEASGGLAAQTVTSSSGGAVWTSGSVTTTRKIKAVAFTGTATSEQDLSFSLPSSAIVEDCWVKITTASSAAGTISVGLITTSSGDADGFIVSLGTSSTGIAFPQATITSATSGDTVTGCTRGALLAFYSTGTTQDEFGNYARLSFVTDSKLEKGVSATLNSTSGTAGYIYFQYVEI